MMVWLLAGILTAVLIVRFYVRHSPHEAAMYHVADSRYSVAGNYPSKGGFEAIRDLAEPGNVALDRLIRVIEETSRTVVLDGALEDGHISFVTRSPFWGFPDTTNIWLNHHEGGADQLFIQGHQRFGRSDLGVNQRRILHWLAVARL